MEEQKEKIRELIRKLMTKNGIRSLEELGEILGAPLNSARQSKYSKAKRVIDSLDRDDLLLFAGLFGVPYRKLIGADPSILEDSVNATAIGNSVNFGDGNVTGNNNQSNVNSGGDPYMDKIFAMDLPDEEKAKLLSNYFESKK